MDKDSFIIVLLFASFVALSILLRDTSEIISLLTK